MKRKILISVISFVIAAALWVVEIVFNPSNWEPELAIAACIFSIIFICYFVICICCAVAAKRGRTVSPYRIFAITDVIIGVLVAVYSVYDIMTDTGFFAGLVGTLLLVFVLPIVVVLLLGDFICWRVHVTKNKREEKQ
ncbi:MAG: hypothetical protein ACI4R6_05185 [Lachnospiraceae bacterium]